MSLPKKVNGHVVLEGVDPRLLAFCHRNGLVVTSGRNGKHNAHSKHPRGLALDFRSRTLTEEFVLHLFRDAKKSGLRLLDERTRPPGQKVWGGPHFHVEVLTWG